MGETRQEIMRAAMEHFASMDYSTVNMEAIAREAHVTRAPLYYYFKNKEGLFRAVVEASLEEAKSKMDAILSADENIFEIIRKEYACCVHVIGKYRKIWYPGLGAPDCRTQVETFSQWLVHRKRDIFTMALQRGELRSDCDVSEIVTLIYVFYDGVLDVQKSTERIDGFNRNLLEHSED